MCQFYGNENLISKAKIQNKNTANTIRKCVRFYVKKICTNKVCV